VARPRGVEPALASIPEDTETVPQDNVLAEEDASPPGSAPWDAKIFISAYRVDGSSYYANVGINLGHWPQNKPKVNFKMLHDTGACASILNKAIYDQLPEPCKPVLQPVDVEVVSANNGIIHCYGLCTVDLDLGGCNFQARMLVCDITNDGIIGTDFMYDNHDCQIRVDRMRNSIRTRATWTIDGHSVPLYPYRPRQSVVNLVSRGDLHIPAGSEYFVRTMAMGPCDVKETYLVTMAERDSSSLDNLQVANTLVHPKQGETIVRLVNVSDHPVAIHAGDVLAKLERVSHCYISDHLSEGDSSVDGEEEATDLNSTEKKRIKKNVEKM